MPNPSLLRSQAARLAWITPPFLVGGALRRFNLDRQILAGDELYAVQAALTRTIGEILSTYQIKDPCLPLAALYRLFVDAGLQLSEGLLRAPILLGGFATLLLVPLYAEHRLGRPTAAIVAWLLALSPLLVFYSRIVRPYGPLVPLSFGAIVAFDAWWRRPRFGVGLLYVLLAGLSAYFHLGSIPYLLAPIPFALAAHLRRRSPSWTAIALLSLGLLLSLLSFMVPARDSLGEIIAGKRNPLEVVPSTFTGVGVLLAGARTPTLALLLWLLASVGLARLLRRVPSVGFLGLLLVIFQLVGLLILSPEMLAHPLVMGRYLIPTLPWLLIWVASAVAALGEVVAPSRRRLVLTGASVLLLVTLLLDGPLSDRFFRHSSFVHHNDFVAFFCPLASLPETAVPAFYQRSETFAEGPIVELPYHRWWAYMRLPYIYQQEHRREVLAAMVPRLPERRRLALRNTVQATPEALLESRATLVVLHRDLPSEEEQVDGHCWPIVPEMLPNHRRLLQRAGRRKLDELTARWGAPDYADGRVVVWDLEKIRLEATPGPGEHRGESSRSGGRR